MKGRVGIDFLYIKHPHTTLVVHLQPIKLPPSLFRKNKRAFLSMGNAEYDEYSSSMKGEKNRKKHQVEIPAAQPFLKSLKNTVKETLFPDDPLRQFKNQPPLKKLILGLQYFFPIFEWAPRYTLDFFKSDLISGITIASLAIPQGISYAKLANLPPILGLCKSYKIVSNYLS